jgi:hypothetical protein
VDDPNVGRDRHLSLVHGIRIPRSHQNRICGLADGRQRDSRCSRERYVPRYDDFDCRSWAFLHRRAEAYQPLRCRCRNQTKIRSGNPRRLLDEDEKNQLDSSATWFHLEFPRLDSPDKPSKRSLDGSSLWVEPHRESGNGLLVLPCTVFASIILQTHAPLPWVLNPPDPKPP